MALLAARGAVQKILAAMEASSFRRGNNACTYSDIGFADRGTHALKGVPDQWQLFTVEDPQLGPGASGDLVGYPPTENAPNAPPNVGRRLPVDAPRTTSGVAIMSRRPSSLPAPIARSGADPLTHGRETSMLLAPPAPATLRRGSRACCHPPLGRACSG
jgi:hypothetical protein